MWSLIRMISSLTHPKAVGLNQLPSLYTTLTEQAETPDTTTYTLSSTSGLSMSWHRLDLQP